MYICIFRTHFVRPEAIPEAAYEVFIDGVKEIRENNTEYGRFFRSSSPVSRTKEPLRDQRFFFCVPGRLGEFRILKYLPFFPGS